MTKLKTKIEQEEKELEDKKKYLSAKKRLMIQFSDAEVRTNRWGRERICSEEVNSKATEAEIYHSCGCCADSPLLVSPYIEVDGVKVFSKPESFCVGEKNGYGWGERAYDEWEDHLRKHNISEEVIKQVEKYFEENPEGYDHEDDY